MNSTQETNHQYPDIDYEEIVKETPLAYLFKVDGVNVWVPKSECELHEDDKQFNIPRWMAKEKELL